jgi:UDP-N-acetylmuramyl pentapeptide phosphotransferase/UDP-N-acetylglucosamine-1-phosphate transferase
MGDDVPFLIACAAAAALTPALAALGVRAGLVDRPGELKIHSRPIPVTGGPAVVAAALLGAALTGHGDPWVAAAVCLALGGGLADDVRPLPPWVRLAVQSGAGVLLVLGGLRLTPLGAAGGLALVFTTVVCCNAVNMVDGQDGLASGLGALAALGLAGVLAVDGAAAPLPLGIAGALVGFLAWNRPPARVFLGDAGAYALGVLLAASAAQTATTGWPALLAAGVCLGVFAYELVSTVVRRLASATPAALGDREHSYDRFAVRLGSRLGSSLVMWSLGAVCSLLAVFVVANLAPLSGVVIVAAVTIVAGLVDMRLIPLSLANGHLPRSERSKT